MEIATISKTDSDNKILFSESLLGARWEVLEPSQKDILTIVQQQQVSEMVARLLLNRKVMPENAAAFLNPSIKDSLPDPFHLLDMEKAAERIARAILNKEKIAIFGDYDVDGATSSALLLRFLRMCGVEAMVYIPDRLLEGYGLNTDALVNLRKENKIDVVVTVDCGTVSFEPIEAANKVGLEVIVVDHHISTEELPKALAVINPNRVDEKSPHRNLAAVGVAFLLAVAIRSKLRAQKYFAGNIKEPDLLKLRDLVALGTVCDVMTLTGLNRVYVSRGVEILRQRTNKGLAALADVAGINTPPDVYHLGYILGPRINAGGRVGKSDLGCRLLATEDANEAITIAKELDKLNRERQAIELQVTEEAFLQAEKKAAENSIIIVSSAGWHPGVIGIVASRIKEKFNKPVAVVAIENGIGKASVRSISGVDIGAAITAAKQSDILVNGGGHPMAAGFTIEEGKLAELENFLNQRIKKDVDANSGITVMKLDGVLPAHAVSVDLAKSLQRAAPFGMGNREPKFVIKDAMIIESRIVGEDHVSCIIGDGGATADKRTRIKAIAFRQAGTRLGKELLAGYGKKLHLAAKIKLDNWQGKDRVDLIIEDASLDNWIIR